MPLTFDDIGAIFRSDVVHWWGDGDGRISAIASEAAPVPGALERWVRRRGAAAYGRIELRRGRGSVRPLRPLEGPTLARLLEALDAEHPGTSWLVFDPEPGVLAAA